MVAAPPAALLDKAATTKADCSKPQGHATHAAPALAARRGMRTTCQPSERGTTAVGTRPRRESHAGCRPRQSSQAPNTSAAALSSVHSGRSAGLNCDQAARAATLDAAKAPPAA